MSHVIPLFLFVGSTCLCVLALLSFSSLQKNQFLTLLSPNLGFPAMPLGSAVDILATDDPSFNQEDQQDTQIYEKHDNLLHGTKKKK